MSVSDFSSWPREQEASFVVFEQRAMESQSKAWTMGGIVAGLVLLFVLGVTFGVTPDKDPHKEAEKSSVTKKADAPAEK